MIKRLYIHNFRCLENFELPISGRSSTLLIGRNGAGKSTIGFALGVLKQIACGTNRISKIVPQTDFTHGRSEIPIRFEIEVDIDGNTYGYTLALELPVDFKELRVFEERLSYNEKTIYSRDGAQVSLSKTASDTAAKFLVDWHLVALPVIQEQSTTDPLYTFKSWLSQMLILSPIPSLMTGDSNGDTLTPSLDVADFGEWWTGLISRSPAAYTHIDKYLREVMPDFKDIQNPFEGKDSRSLTVQFQQDRASISLPFKDLSDGEKCFFVCAVVLAASRSGNPFFCFWDEPDNYLSMSEVGHFVMALRQSFQSGGQLLVTSHNPEAVRKFSNENTLILGRRNHLEPTIVRLLSDMHIEGDLIEALIRNDVEPWQ